jgi:hypothetical protein
MLALDSGSVASIQMYFRISAKIPTYYSNVSTNWCHLTGEVILFFLNVRSVVVLILEST